MSGNTTVLIPFLNGGNEQWLNQCIGSLPKDTPYLVIRNDGELHTALNTGLEAADTEFVFVTGADDVIVPGCLPLLESLCWNVDVTYPSMVLTDEELEPTGFWAAYPFDGHRLLQWNFVPGAFLARTEKLKEVGGWRELEALEDWDLHVRMYRAGARFKPVPEAQILYRQVEGSRNKGLVDPEVWRSQIVGQAEPVQATWYYQATPATTYWRCQVPARHLPGRCLPDHALVMSEDDVEFPEHEGAAIFQFPGDKMRAFISTVAMPSVGIRTLAEVDDNYLVSRPHRTWSGWGRNIGDMPHTLEGHRAIVARLDGVICTTERLAYAYQKVNPNVYVCPNSIDPTDWPVIEKPDDGIFRVGWYASHSHADDGQLIRRGMEWASKQKDVEVVTMGHDPGWKFRRRHVPWSNDLATYWKAMEILDVGVCPVRPNLWSECRSDVKALEYAMGGAAPILSGEAPYEAWENERGCLKARTAKGFYESIKRLVNDRAETQQLAMEAKEYVLSNRTIADNISSWRNAVHGV